ncbi:hypothetical protein OF83DRAFT_729189 [Amylostereum chailletii]|nr:hypothetical protein OF83DRAFT_729189 [Amylostereum chailletii]
MDEHNSLPEAAQAPSDTSMSRTPPEIFHRIFSQLSDEHKEQLPPSVPPVLLLSHVCRWWRDITVEMHELWSHVPLKSYHLAELFLQHSSTFVIILLNRFDKFNNIQTCDDDALLLVFSHLGRIKDMHIDVSYLSPARIQSISQGIHGTPAPQLRSLHISSLPLLPQFLSGQTLPTLKKITLIGASVRLEHITHLFKAPLTSLILRGPMPGDESVPNSFDLLLDVPSGLPSLQILILKRVELPSLRKLRLDDTSSAVATLMRYLSLPISVEMWLSCLFHDHAASRNISIAEAATMLSDHFSSSNFPGLEFRTMTVSTATPTSVIRSHDGGFILSNPRLIGDPKHPTALLAPTFRFDFRIQLEAENDDNTENEMQRLWRIFPGLHGVRTVHFDGGSKMEAVSLRALFRHACHIETIALRGGFPSELTHATAATALDEGDSQSRLLPCLHTITISAVRLTELSSVPGHTTQMAFDLLIEFWERHSATCKGLLLQIKQCDLFEHQAVVLQRWSSGEVRWDGHLKGHPVKQLTWDYVKQEFV